MQKNYLPWVLERYWLQSTVISAMMDKPLLVIRPLREGDEFLGLLSSADIPYQHIPIMKINSLVSSQKQTIVSLINDLDQFNYVIFISANAAELALPLIAKRWTDMPSIVEFVAVGQQTAGIFEEYGYPVCCTTEQPNTEGLLRELPQLQNLEGKSVVIFRGGEGRQTLGSQLAARGADVVYCNLYQRVIEPDQVSQAQAFLSQASCLVAHSGELLQGLGAHQVKHIPLIVPSARIAQQARKLGYEDIEVAQNALPESMYDAVIRVRQK